MNRAYIALGTNIEPRHTHLKKAIEALENHESIQLISQSSIYETAPVGYIEQADFLNMVLEIETSLLPSDLLDVCQHIEQGLGRERTIRFGPRTIDLDILVYNDENIKTDRLIVPHPRMHERAFVLVPLNEIGVRLTIQGASVTEFLSNLSEKDIKEVVQWTPNEPEDK